MALTLRIVDAEYKQFDGRDHLYYLIFVKQHQTGWENNVELRYSEIKYLHKQISLSEHLFKATRLPKIPTWVRFKAIFTNKMDEETIRERRNRLEDYLNALSQHLVTRSTPYFDKIFRLPPKVIIYWVKNYESFQGIRQVENVKVRLGDIENVSPSPEREDKGIQANKSISVNTFVKSMKKQKLESAGTTPKKKFYRSKQVDTKNSINMFNQTELSNEEVKREIDLIKLNNQRLNDENQRLREDMEKRIQEVENIKKTYSRDLIGAAFANKTRSVNIATPVQITPDKGNSENDPRGGSDTLKDSAKPNLSWGTLVNIFKSREQKIPAEPQPISIKPEALKRKAKTSPARDKRKQYASKHKNLSEKLYEDDYSEEEYIIIEEDEESEDETEPLSGVFTHF